MRKTELAIEININDIPHGRARATVMAFMYGVPAGTMQQVINNIYNGVMDRMLRKMTGVG